MTGMRGLFCGTEKSQLTAPSEPTESHPEWFVMADLLSEQGFQQASTGINAASCHRHQAIGFRPNPARGFQTRLLNDHLRPPKSTGLDGRFPWQPCPRRSP